MKNQTGRNLTGGSDLFSVVKEPSPPFLVYKGQPEESCIYIFQQHHDLTSLNSQQWGRN